MNKSTETQAKIHESPVIEGHQARIEIMAGFMRDSLNQKAFRELLKDGKSAPGLIREGVLRGFCYSPVGGGDDKYIPMHSHDRLQKWFDEGGIQKRNLSMSAVDLNNALWCMLWLAPEEDYKKAIEIILTADLLK